MNQYIFLRRMRGPIILLVFGITAILDEYTGIHYPESWPLYLIAWGLLKLAENAILAQHPPSSLPPWPGVQHPGGYPPYTGTATTATGNGTSMSIVSPDDEEGR